MQQYEFQTVWTPDVPVKIPKEVAAHLVPAQPVRVVLLVPDRDEEQEWLLVSCRSN